MDITCSYCPCILLKWVKIQLAIWNETSLVQKWWFKKKLQKDSVMDYWCLASLAGIFSNIYILSKQMCLSSLWGRTETFQFKKPLMTEGHYYWRIKLSQTAQQWWSAGKHFQKTSPVDLMCSITTWKCWRAHLICFKSCWWACLLQKVVISWDLCMMLMCSDAFHFRKCLEVICNCV